MGLPELRISTAVRTGDTPQKDRSAMRKTAPHILVTTPESLYVLLGSDSGRQMLSTTGTVIVDEIHAIAASKRGSHLALSLERLQALCAEPLVRIGLSATQKPIEAVSRFLVGARSPLRDRRYRPRPPPRPGHRSAARAAVGGDGQRCLGAGLRPSCRPRPRTPHHADFRQHPAPGRAPEPAPERTPRQRSRGRPPRQPGQGVSPGRRTAAQARRAAGVDRHRVAGAGHRHWRRRPGVPDRLAALDCRFSATGRTLRAPGRRHAQGPPVRHHPRRPDRMRRAARLRAPGRARHPADPRGAAGRPGATDHRRSQLPGMAGAGVAGDVAPRLALRRARRKTLSGAAADARRGLTTGARASAALICIATP